MTIKETERLFVSLQCRNCDSRYALGWEMSVTEEAMSNTWLKWARNGTARSDVRFTNVQLVYKPNGMTELNRLSGECSNCDADTGEDYA